MPSLLLALLACADPAPPPPAAPAPALPAVPTAWAYDLAFPDGARQLIDVRATSTNGCGDWWMPTWIPGSYVLREFSRNVQQVRAWGPNGALPIDKVAKNRWAVRCEGEVPVTLTYRVAASEMSVRTNHVDSDGAVLNGPAWAIVPPDAQGPVQVRLTSPWPGPWTALPEASPGTLVADSLDQLFDSPILLGEASERSFDIDGRHHRVVVMGANDLWDMDRTATDLEAIVRHQQQMWGAVPYPAYTFLVSALGGRGGLEHRRSTLILADPWATHDDERYERFLSVASHEFFHAWNVKTLRPAGLVPIDYEHEQHTPDLWVAEGITSYYDDLVLRRTQRLSEEAYLERLSGTIAKVADRPGSQVQSLSAASFDAWTEYYLPDAHSVNQSVSYYDKGALVAWLLDARVRRASGGARSLDDVMRDALASHPETYTPEGFRARVDAMAGEAQGEWLAATVDGTDPLDFSDALEVFGLRFAAVDATTGAWHGATTTIRHGRVFVTDVPQGTPAWAAGFIAGDELVAVDGWRVDDEHVRVDLIPADREAVWTVARRGRLRELPMTLTKPPAARWRLEIDPEASLGANRTRRRWLGPEEPTP